MDILKSGKKNNYRKYKGGGPRPDLTDLKRKEAIERDAAWRSLSAEQQLEQLDVRLGVGVGAKKQRARLLKLIEAKEIKSSRRSEKR
jgi:hypothetical protein